MTFWVFVKRDKILIFSCSTFNISASTEKTYEYETFKIIYSNRLWNSGLIPILPSEIRTEFPIFIVANTIPTY